MPELHKHALLVTGGSTVAGMQRPESNTSTDSKEVNETCLPPLGF